MKETKMKRSEFIRTSLLALVGLTVTSFVEPLPLLYVPKKKVVAFKIWSAVLNDPDLFAHILSLHDTGKPILKTEIGYIEDDFIYDLMTVRLTLEK